MNNLWFFLLMLFCLHGYVVEGQVYGKGAVDIDGNNYRSVIIGKQEWLDRNLIVSRFNNGDPITLIQESNEWGTTIGPSYFIYHIKIIYLHTYPTNKQNLSCSNLILELVTL